MKQKVILVSRCAWTLFNFRSGLLKYLKKTGVNVIGGGASGDGFEPYIKDLGVDFKSLPIDKKSLNPVADLRLLISLYRWHRRERPNVVHHFTIKPVIYGSIAAWLAGVPRIVNTITGLGYVFTDTKAVRLRRLVEWMYRIALSRAHWTFFQNNDDYSYFKAKRLINVDRSSVLPGSGVDCSHFSPGSTVPPSNNGLTFLMVSRLIKDKGVYEFVAAAEIIKKRFPQVKFQLLGGRDERNPNVISHSVINDWEKKGFISWLGEKADVRPIMEQADVVVLPSYREGIPRSLLEASAMEKPLITTDTIGCRDVVEDGVTGFLVPVQNSQALAEAMSRFVENPELGRRLGRNGRNKVLREFNENDVIYLTVNQYDLQLPVIAL